MTVDESAQLAPRTAQVANWLSVERLLYGLALVIGLWLRLWNLGGRPLSPWEASNSWPAWLTANALHVVDAPAPNSALYYGMQWLLFWTGINSDSGARFASVIVGGAMILLPWWWRGFLGRRVALIFAFLIAIDSWLLAYGRLADGAVVAISVGLLALVALNQVIEQPESINWKRTAAISLGLLLVSGPMGWNMLPVVLWYGWLFRKDLGAAGMFQRQWPIWTFVAGISGATLFLARFDGMAWVASGMSVWLSQIDGTSAGSLLPAVTGGYDLGWPWLRVWADAAPLIPLGAGGILVAALRMRKASTVDSSLRRFLLFCLGWLLWGVVLCLLPGRSPFALPMIGLPLMILTAYFVDALFTNVPQTSEWREMSAVVITLVILIISGVFWVAGLLATQTYDSTMAQAALVILGLALAIMVGFAVWSNRRDALWIAATLAAVFLIVFYVRSSWKLNFGNVMTEPDGWQATMAHPEVRTLEDDVEKISSHSLGDPFEQPVQVQLASYVAGNGQTIPARPDPVLGWELRNMRNLTWVPAPMVNQDDERLPLVVTPAAGGEDAQALDLPDQYAGSKYHVDAWWLPESISAAKRDASEDSETTVGQVVAESVQPWWRWFVYREAVEAPQNRDVILWAPLNQATQ